MKWVNHILYCAAAAPCGLCILHTVLTDTLAHWKRRRTWWHNPWSLTLGIALGAMWGNIMWGLWAGSIHIILDLLGGAQLWRNLAALVVIILIYYYMGRVPCLA